MGQKVNPHGMRVGVIKDWDSRWYAREDKVGDLIVEDYNIRQFLKKTLYSAGVPKIEIERDSNGVRIFIHCSRPGVVIGKGGAEIQRLEGEVEKKIGKKVKISIVEVRTPDTCAQLVAESIAQQLEKRISYRRAMKNAMGRAMRMGALGIKVMVSGRIGGAEIARSECYHEGTIPLQTLRSTPRTMDLNKAGEEKKNDRRGGRRDNRRGGDRNGFNRDRRQGGYNRDGQRPARKEGGNA